jgi:hypothetical protein
MHLNLIDRIAENNPQLYRELKSRLQPANITIAIATSLTVQILSLMWFGDRHKDLLNSNDFIPAHWKLWFSYNFFWLSGAIIFVLLVAGSYMLVADLSKERQKGTLNLIKQSPESARNILFGKLLGIPILLYLVVVLALPLHFLTGFFAEVPIGLILGFYAILISSCIFFYSLALLYALLPIGKDTIKAGLFSVATAVGLLYTSLFIYHRATNPWISFNWIVCFYPWKFLEKSFLSGLFSSYLGHKYKEDIFQINWYNLPVSSNAIAICAFLVLNYSIWSFWIWRCLTRYFDRPDASLLTKSESYWFTATWHALVLGFAVNLPVNESPEIYWTNFSVLLLFELALYFILIGALTPHYQAIRDWARYRYYNKFGGKGKLWQDLILGEKSPAIIAIGLNAILANLAIGLWVLWMFPPKLKILALGVLLIAISLTLIYACLTQLMWLRNSHQRRLGMGIALVGLTVLPPIFAIVNITHGDRVAWIWLFSIFPSVAALSVSIPDIVPLGLISACLIQWLGVAVLGWQLQRRLKQMGASPLLKA